MVSIIILSGCALFKRDPQKAVQEGMANFADVEKLNSDLILSGIIRAPAGEKPEQVKFSVKLAGTSDYSKDSAPKLDTTLKFSAEADGKGISGEASLRLSEKKAFFNVTNLNLPNGAAKEELKAIFNSWWSVPLEESNPFGKFGEQQKKVLELFKTTQFFTNAAEDGEEKVQDEDSTRFRVDLNKDALKQFILEAMKLTESSLTPEQELSLTDSLKNLEFSGAVWIGDDDVLHRVKGTLASHPTDGSATSIDLDYSAGNFGKKVLIATPEGAKEFNPLAFVSVLGAFGGFDEEGTSTEPQVPAR